MAKLKARSALKDDLLRLARELIDGEGLAAVQARTLAEKAGCSVGTIYNSFERLDDLILAVNAATLADLWHNLRQALGALDGPLLEERLAALAFAYLDFARAKPGAWRAIFEHRMDNGTEVPDWYREAQAPLFAILDAALPQSMPAKDRLNAGRMLFSATHGIVALAVDQKLSDQFDEASTRAQLCLLVAAMAKHLGATG